MAKNLIEMVFRADNRSTIKALNQIADTSQKTRKKVTEDADKNSASFERMGHSATMLRDSVRGLAGMVGLGGLAFGLKDAIQGGMELQGSQAQLRQALKATGQEAHGTAESLQAYAEKLSTHGGFAVPQNLAALTAYVRETHSATRAQSMLSLATDIARGRNMDLGSAQMIVARAYTGQVGRLQQLLGPMVAAKNAQYGLTQAHKEQIAQLELESKAYGKLGPQWLKQKEIADGITPQMHALAVLQDKTATAQQVLNAAQTVFAGATGTYAGTTQGKISDLQHSLKNLTDTTGEKLLPAINMLAHDATSVVTAFSKLPTPVQAGALGLTALGLIAGPLHNSFRLLKDMVDGTRTIMRLFGVAVGEDTAAERANAGATAENAVANAASRGENLARALSPAVLAMAASFEANALTGSGGGGGGRGMVAQGISGATFGAVTPQQARKTLNHGGGFLGGLLGGIPGLGPILGALDLTGSSASQPIHVHLTSNVVMPDGRVLAKTVTDQVIRKAARGPSSLVGGSLMAASPR